jgi:hypothetical protein
MYSYSSLRLRIVLRRSWWRGLALLYRLCIMFVGFSSPKKSDTILLGKRGLRTLRTPLIPIHSPFVLPPSGVIPSPLSTLNTIHSINARYLSTVPCTIENILCLPNNVGLGAMKTSDVVVVVGAPLKDLVGRRMGEAGVRVLNHWGG